MSVNKKNDNLVRLGDYIELCDERNNNQKYTLDDVRGISILKKIIPTKADMQDVSLFPYKLLKPKEFCYVTVTSRNGGKISLAINDSDETYLVSSSYEVFRCKNTDELLPNYLFLLLNREEFDRLSRFNSWGSARETFDWSELCRIQIPLPDIATQQELVDTYNGLKALAEQNEALIKPLTEACQAYIVDCKKKYTEVELGEYIEQTEKRNNDLFYGVNDVVGMTITKQIIPTKADVGNMDLAKFLIVSPREFVYNPRTHGKKIGLGFNNNDKIVMISWNNISFKVKNSKLDISVMPEYLYLLFCREEWDREACYRSLGSSTEVFSWFEMCNMKIPLPPPEVQQAIVNLYHCAEEAKNIAIEAREKMKILCPALVQRAING
jgi:type I restriction enzyme S subunit